MSLLLAILSLHPVGLASAKQVGNGNARKQPVVLMSLAFQPKSSGQMFAGRVEF